ncbi:MAG: hypothetical protein ACREDR_39520 [Blastocatellia bacterium]
MIGIPVKLSETPGQIRRPAPTLGQHTDELLNQLVINSEEITVLREKKAVF